MFKGIKDALMETGLIEELCSHLRQIGLDARVVDSKSADTIHHSPAFGFFDSPPLGSIERHLQKKKRRR